ncbi:MAG TPA: GNAT family N-acetyltransferase [Deltaproteobacteria bacterium]|nr:GNAT family N-acetyltransferase [Deltaproteobacteria bacterium]
MGDVIVREALEADVEQIRDIFTAVYRGDYPFEAFTDLRWLKRSVFNDDIVMLVAEDQETGALLGTASVVFDLGAHSDLLAEFGRLAVSPAARGRGVGSLLMQARCDLIGDRLHLGLAQNRCTHPFSQRISLSHGFAAVGFLPMKYAFQSRESVALWARLFGPALSLRRNHPRIVPEAHALATLALQGCGLPDDVVVDEEASSYPPPATAFLLEELTARGLPALLRIERGRVHNREVFGPVRLHYGYFQLEARHATYLVARDPASHGIAGAIGYLHDEANASVHVFELIAQEEGAARALLEGLLARGRSWGLQYLEIDVSAHAPRMQRTLLELGFLPAGYVPAMVFHDVERLDIVKLVRLSPALQLGELQLIPETQRVASVVIRAFTEQQVLPRIEAALGRIELFAGLSREQSTRVASLCRIREFEQGRRLFGPSDPASELLIPLEGRCAVRIEGQQIGCVGPGESLGELAMLLDEDHRAEVIAEQPLTAAILGRPELQRLSRNRPDIAATLYRNLARGLGRKLRRMDRAISPDEA